MRNSYRIDKAESGSMPVPNEVTLVSIKVIDDIVSSTLLGMTQNVGIGLGLQTYCQMIDRLGSSSR